MTSWCPKCQRPQMVTTHYYNDTDGKIYRSETVCSVCHTTLSVHHYQQPRNIKPTWPERRPRFGQSAAMRQAVS